MLMRSKVTYHQGQGHLRSSYVENVGFRYLHDLGHLGSPIGTKLGSNMQ